MKKIYMGALILMFAFLVSGCVSSDEKIYEALEQTAVKESDFEKLQQPLADLELKEKSLFDEMMALGMKDFEEITKLADEAIGNLDQRESLMKKEKEAMDASKSQFDQFNSQINQIKDEKVKKQAEQLKKVMEDRYESHENLYKSYLDGLAEDRKIYNLIKDKELKIEDLEVQIESTNKVYEKVFTYNEEFNLLTEKFNEAKASFYKEAGINAKPANAGN